MPLQPGDLESTLKEDLVDPIPDDIVIPVDIVSVNGSEVELTLDFPPIPSTYFNVNLFYSLVNESRLTTPIPLLVMMSTQSNNWTMAEMLRHCSMKK